MCPTIDMTAVDCVKSSLALYHDEGSVKVLANHRCSTGGFALHMAPNFSLWPWLPFQIFLASWLCSR